MTKTLPAYRKLSQAIWPTAYSPRASDWNIIQQIRAEADSIASCTDVELATRTTELRARVRGDESPLKCEILQACFAISFEAVRRVTGMSFYDVQLIAGLALATGSIAEMKTGEGKTIVAVLPTALRALTGRGVHVATVNSYLAQRDHAMLAPVFELMGFTVGHAKDQDKPASKRRAYACDVTYGTGYEFGFDYLRDQAALRNVRRPTLGEKFRARLRGVEDGSQQFVQRGHAFAVIDEVDSVLIDEANTPLVLSSDPGGREVDETPYRRAVEVGEMLKEHEHFVIDRRRRTINLTERGQTIIFQSHTSMPIEGLVRPWQTYVEQALRARLLLQKDVEYVIQEQEIRIVDQYTGRIFSDRTWREGLHQAVEVKENVPVTHEKSSLGRISRQRYFGLYESMCGMTGTATGHERELQEFYQLPVVVIPERLPNQRKIESSRYFANQESKWDAIAQDICRRYKSCQPVLVGTRTIDESEVLSQKLKDRSIPHQVLNGLQTVDEAELISKAGHQRTITIATNMAGRGTDIKLGEGVESLGGLHVIATERQESQRVDRQLIGRSARQGKAGSCQFFVSGDDDLVQQFRPGFAKRLTSEADDQGEIRNDLQKEMDRTQRSAERQRFQQRSDLYRQDQWMNDILTTVAEKDAPSIGTQSTAGPMN